MKKQNKPESAKNNEYNYSMIIRIMREVIPTVKTIGFVTAENPMIEEVVKKYEKDAKTKFKDHLKDSHYGHTKVMGKYDTLENPYFIPNISKEYLLKFGKTYNQAHIIYGEKVEDGDYEGFKFQLILTFEDFGTIQSEKHIFINKDDYSDSYIEINGQDFQIPFIDGTDDNVEFKEYSNLFLKIDITDNVSKELLSEIEDLSNRAFNTVGFNQWANRGLLRKRINELYRQGK